MNRFFALLLAVIVVPSTPASVRGDDPKPGEPLVRRGDEIIVCGRLVHTGTPVVTWLDPGGYDAYRVERRFVPLDKAGWDATAKEGKIKSPNRYGPRFSRLKPGEIEHVRTKGWDLPTLQGVVDQFVIHFDACGTSRRCFQVLHDERGLSVHFMLDLDGTIYQTLDLKESAWHATKANGRSIGIEIANLGTVGLTGPNRLDSWYKQVGNQTTITIPGPAESNGIHNRSIPLVPSRPDPIVGNVQGQDLKQYDLTPAQYAALIKLTATLHAVFPKIRPDFPRDAEGKLVTKKLDDDVYDRYAGILGHFHVQTNKVDPGPAFQWELLIAGVKAIEGKP